MKDILKEESFYIVEGNALPEIFLKVLEVTELLKTQRCKNVSEATEKVNISRSAYYKYKDKIKPFNQLAMDTILTFSCVLFDKAGILSNVLAVFAKFGASIITINQNIPSNGIAVVTISATTADMTKSVEKLIKTCVEVDGVMKFDVLSST